MRLTRRCSFLLLLTATFSLWIMPTPLKAQNQPWQNIETLLYVIRSRINAALFRYDEAIADMDAAIALDPDNPLLYVERGQRILLLYEWDRALADFNHALELHPNYAAAYYYRALLYASVPEGSEARQSALADFERYLALAPNGSYAENAAQNSASLQAQLDALAEPAS